MTDELRTGSRVTKTTIRAEAPTLGDIRDREGRPNHAELQWDAYAAVFYLGDAWFLLVMDASLLHRVSFSR